LYSHIQVCKLVHNGNRSKLSGRKLITPSIIKVYYFVLFPWKKKTVRNNILNVYADIAQTNKQTHIYVCNWRRVINTWGWGNIRVTSILRRSFKKGNIT